MKKEFLQNLVIFFLSLNFQFRLSEEICIIMKLVVILIIAYSIRSSISAELAADFVYNPVHVEDVHVVQKREVSQSAKPTRKEMPDNYTSVKTEGGCKLFVLEVIFLKKKFDEAGKAPTISEIRFPGTHLESVNDGDCANRTGTIILNYVGGFTSNLGEHLESLNLTFNITYLKAYGWWEVTELYVEANGDFVKREKKDEFKVTFNKTVLNSVAMGASKKFSYACSQPPTLFYSENKATLIYGLQFRDLQIQPFEWGKSPGNFTNNVDDCVPFFSIGIWMFLVVAAVLLLVVFFGIGMISSLKTMDRFDDPKGKPLVISAKE